MSGDAALVTGAGSSLRMGGGGKKEYRLVDGVPVLVKSLLAFRETGLFDFLVATVPRGEVERARALIAPFLPPSAVELVEGGGTRQESVYRGLSFLKGTACEFVLIHDAARPWVEAELIREVLKVAREHGAALPVVEINDAAAEVEPGGEIVRYFNRSEIWGVQTPQGFRFTEILAAHEQVQATGRLFSDDAQVLIHGGKSVFTLPGNQTNRKITHPHDLEGR